MSFLHTLQPLAGPAASRSLGPIGRLALVAGKFKMAARVIEEQAAPPASHTAAGEQGRYLSAHDLMRMPRRGLHGDANPDFTSPGPADRGRVVPPTTSRAVECRTGTAMGDRKLGMMREVAQDNLSHLTDAEIAALYEYLHALAGG